MKNILNIEREIHLYQDLYHEHVTIYMELQIRKKSLRAGTDTRPRTRTGLALGSGRNFLLKHGFGLGPDSDARVQIYACPPSPDSFEMIF